MTIAVNNSVAGVPGVFSTTFAALPSANTMNGQRVWVSDVGVNGSFWYASGGQWVPETGVINLFNSAIPFFAAPTGSITVTTGALALGTALDSGTVYTDCYMYFPSNAWTGSTAGFYYVQMSSTTAGLVYSNTYTSGIPVIPASPTLVTTGAGAYTGVTAVDEVAYNFTIPANCMGKNGRLEINFCGTLNNTAGAKTWDGFFGATNFINLVATTTTIEQGQIIIANYGATNKQMCLSNIAYSSAATGSENSGTIDTTAAQTLSLRLKTAVATDWCSLLNCSVKLVR